MELCGPLRAWFPLDLEKGTVEHVKLASLLAKFENNGREGTGMRYDACCCIIL